LQIFLPFFSNKIVKITTLFRVLEKLIALLGGLFPVEESHDDPLEAPGSGGS
jgi:hypothetical protein